MKPPRILAAAILAALPLVMNAAKSAPTPSRAEVVFIDPDKFTDVRDSYTGTDSGRDAILDQLRTYFEDESRRYVPEGDKVMLSISDIDLAGDFEPWRGPQWDDVRVVKDIYPPRIKFSFRLTDSSGHVVKEGARDIRDMNFLMKITMAFQDDPLRHEKQLIDDWYAEEFRGLTKH